MRQSPPQYSLSSGELSPLLHGRPDYIRHQSGARFMRGFVPMEEGGATRAPGTIFRGEVRGSAEARLISFVFSEQDAVTLEFSAGFMRVWRYGALVQSGGSPYELAIPYDYAAIRRLQWVQSADVIYMCDGQRPVQALQRAALDNWSIGDAQFELGPFRGINTNDAITVTASAGTGTVTLTASSGIFSADMVGSPFYLETFDNPVPKWVGNETVSVGTQRLNDGRIYQVVSGTNTGVNAPFHLRGRQSSESAGVVWEFIADHFGVVKITGFTSSTQVTGTVQRRLPPGVVSNATHLWAEGAWSDKNGYPGGVTIADQRLSFGYTAAEPRTAWFSTLGAFRNFEPSDLPDAAFTYTISGDDGQNPIQWLKGSDQGVVIGALGEEHAARSGSGGEAISATNVRFRPESRVGSAPEMPIAPQGAPIFISRDRRRLFRLRYVFQSDRMVPTELSRPSSHLTAPGLEEIVFQSAPRSLAWLRRTDGEVLIMVSNEQEEVLGWCLVPLDGAVCESLSVAPSADDGRDIVTAIIRREVNGQTKRFVEEFADIQQVITGAANPETAVHHFSSIVFDPGGEISTLTGLDHLEGETVSVWSDQGDLSDKTVVGGSIELELSVGYAVVGLRPQDQGVETLDLGLTVNDGGAVGRAKKPKGLAVRLHETSALQMRWIARDVENPEPESEWVDVIKGRIAPGANITQSGVVNVDFTGSWAPQVSAQFRPSGGGPATILEMTPMLEVSGA